MNKQLEFDFGDKVLDAEEELIKYFKRVNELNYLTSLKLKLIENALGIPRNLLNWSSEE
jgi:hypothetical protein